MKINSRSWHYRFNAKIQRDKFTDRVRCGRHTTCSYIRTTIYSAMQALWFTFILCIIVAFVAFFLGSAIWVPIAIFFLNGVPGGMSIAAAGIVWVLVAIGLGYLTYKFLPAYLPKRDPNKEPNVFIQAVKDQHNKVCTRIEVV
ncbi:hypothetical protein D3C80_1245830 [compost metagenome]